MPKTLSVFFKSINYYFLRYRSQLFGLTCVIVAISIMYVIVVMNQLNRQDPTAASFLIIIILISFLLISMLFYGDLYGMLLRIVPGKRKLVNSKLQRKVVSALCLCAIIPAILMSLFSTYFFNFGLKGWFDDRVSNLLSQSTLVGESYIKEHKMQLKQTANAAAEDINNILYHVIHNRTLFNQVLNTLAEVRSLDEAVVFQQKTNLVLAQTDLSFALPFMSIPLHILEKAAEGHVVEIDSEPSKIRYIVKLDRVGDAYLIIGRLIDRNIINHIDSTNGSVAEYRNMQSKMLTMQIQYFLCFMLLSLALTAVAIIWGQQFAKRLVAPVIALVKASEKVKKGDYGSKVSTSNVAKDEVKLLVLSFNRMLDQLNKQQKDLAIAQRALAWSDVARKVAHEIKNPLTPILLSGERLNKKFANEVGDKESFNRCISSILRNSGEIKRIVEEFTNFARLPTPNFREVEITSLIREYLDERKLLHSDIKYNYQSNVNSLAIICDRFQLYQVIENLVQNSEEAFKGKAANDKNIIEIIIHNSKDILTIYVQDNGPGFNRQIVDSAKQTYVTTKQEGSGLGLAIAEKIITDHYGKLEISNKQKDSGARVKLTLPTKELRNKFK